MATTYIHDGFAELRRARRRARPMLIAVFIFSIVVNLLALTGPVFMLQIYDRVLSSQSVETLAALTALMTILFVVVGILDTVRGRIMTRVAARFQEDLEGRVFAAALEDARSGLPSPDEGGLRELEHVQRLISSPVLLALLDLPWAPFFIGALFIFHPVLGIAALIGTAVLVLTTFLHQRMALHPLQDSARETYKADQFSARMRAEAELVRSLGMKAFAFERWKRIRERAMDATVLAGDRSNVFTVFSRTFRIFLQSAMLAVGAWLVLQNEISGGVMIASSILLGRGLAPIDQVVGGWQTFERAQDGWKKLGALLSRQRPRPPMTALPRPQGQLEVLNLTVVPPGQSLITLRGVSFRLAPGQALGVIGPSGSGKSTLARALTGAWSPAGGAIRLGGATVDQYDPDVYGRLVGYLPQQVSLFDGTLAENIARLDPAPDPERVVGAAQKAAAHMMILDMPLGYDTPVSAASQRLSGGQTQRVGLARALYSDPVLLVLDEPNANLDAVGTEALNEAIRTVKAGGGSVVIMAHRPAAIAECDLLLVLDGGRVQAFGPRDEVLKKTVQNAARLDRAFNPAGGA